MHSVKKNNNRENFQQLGYKEHSHVTKEKGRDMFSKNVVLIFNVLSLYKACIEIAANFKAV